MKSRTQSSPSTVCVSVYCCVVVCSCCVFCLPGTKKFFWKNLWLPGKRVKIVWSWNLWRNRRNVQTVDQDLCQIKIHFSLLKFGETLFKGTVCNFITTSRKTQNSETNSDFGDWWTCRWFFFCKSVLVSSCPRHFIVCTEIFVLCLWKDAFIGLFVTSGRRAAATDGRRPPAGSAAASGPWLSSLHVVSTEPDRPEPPRECWGSDRTGTETKPPPTDPDPSGPTPTQDRAETPAGTTPGPKEPSEAPSQEPARRLQRRRGTFTVFSSGIKTWFQGFIRTLISNSTSFLFHLNLRNQTFFSKTFISKLKSNNVSWISTFGRNSDSKLRLTILFEFISKLHFVILDLKTDIYLWVLTFISNSWFYLQILTLIWELGLSFLQFLTFISKLSSPNIKTSCTNSDFYLKIETLIS